MTIAVVCYSRTGHTRRLAREIAARADAELIEIACPRYGSGGMGVVRGLLDAIRDRKPAIDTPPVDLSRFDALALGGPVWAGRPAPPLHAFLAEGRALPPRVGLFLTGAAKVEQTPAIERAASWLGRPFDASISLGNGQESPQELDRTADTFLARLRPDLAAAS